MAVSKNKFNTIKGYGLSCTFKKSGYSWVDLNIRYIVKAGKVFYLVNKKD